MLQANLWSRVAKYPVQPQSTHEGALRLLLLPNERKIKPPDWWINLDIITTSVVAWIPSSRLTFDVNFITYAVGQKSR